MSSTPLYGQLSFETEGPDEPEETIVYNDQLIKLKMVINPMWEFESAAVKISMSKNEKFVRSAAPDNNGKYDLYLRYGEVYGLRCFLNPDVWTRNSVSTRDTKVTMIAWFVRSLRSI